MGEWQTQSRFSWRFFNPFHALWRSLCFSAPQSETSLMCATCCQTVMSEGNLAWPLASSSHTGDSNRSRREFAYTPSSTNFTWLSLICACLTMWTPEKPVTRLNWWKNFSLFEWSNRVVGYMKFAYWSHNLPITSAYPKELLSLVELSRVYW